MAQYLPQCHWSPIPSTQASSGEASPQAPTLLTKYRPNTALNSGIVGKVLDADPCLHINSAVNLCRSGSLSRCGSVSSHRSSARRLTFAAVHLMAVEASERLGSTGQTHGPRSPSPSLLDVDHRPAQAAVHQPLQRLHCHRQRERQRESQINVSK